MANSCAAQPTLLLLCVSAWRIAQASCSADCTKFRLMGFATLRGSLNSGGN